MSKPTWIGGLVLLLSLIVARFVDIWAGVPVAVVGTGVVGAGLVLDRRRQRAAVAPSVSWAEELTARVRAERAAAARGAAGTAPAAGPAQEAPRGGAEPLTGAVG